MNLNIKQIQDKLQERRPGPCPDNVWDKFLDFFPTLCKTGDESEFPDLIYWCNIPDEEALEVSYSHQYITIFIDKNLVCEIADHSTGQWYSEDEVRTMIKDNF